MPLSYFNCLYCIPFKGGHGKKVPKSVGSYRIKIFGDSTLFLQCNKCTRTIKVRMAGKPLLWDDFADVEKIWIGRYNNGQRE